jgi:hypothetical protein
MQASDRTSIRRAGVIAILAAAVAIVADLVLQFTTNTAHLMSRQSLYLLDVPPGRLLLGHYLGVAAILVETVGFWQVYRALKPAGEGYALSFFLINAFGAMLGAAFHGTFVFVGLTLQAQSRMSGSANADLGELLASFNTARIGLALPALAAILVGSLLYAFVVGFRPTFYPRWMALCNPLSFLLLIMAVTLAVPPAALVLAPTALNVSHLLFFIGSTAVSWNSWSNSATSTV